MVVVSPLLHGDEQRIGQGTEVAVKAKDFDSNGARQYVKDILAYKQDADITVNQEKINDTSSLKVREKEMPEKYGQKQRSVKILTSQNTSDKAKVFLTVGGVRVEEFAAEGKGLPETVVIDLPPGTALPKSRDRIEVNSETVEAVATLVSATLGKDLEQSAQLLNAVAPVISHLQERNPIAKRDANMELGMMESIKTWAESFPPDTFLIPSSPDIDKLAIPKAVPIDGRYMPGNVKIPGHQAETAFSSANTRLFFVPFRNETDVIAFTQGNVFVNERFKTNDPRTLGMIKALIDIHDETVDKDSAKVQGTFTLKNGPETHQAPKIPEHAQESPDMVKYKLSFLPQIEGTTRIVTTETPVTVLEVIPDDEIERMEEEIRSKFPIPNRHPIIQLAARLSLTSRISKEEQDARKARVEALIKIPRTREVQRVKTEQRQEKEFTPPESAEQIQSWMLGFSLYGALDYASPLISEDPSFWQGVLTEDFVNTLPNHIGDQSTVITQGLSLLPQDFKTSLLKELQGSKKEDMVEYWKNYSGGIGQIIYNIKNVYKSTPPSPQDMPQFAKAYLAISVGLKSEKYAKTFHDKDLLRMFTASGELADFAKSIMKPPTGDSVNPAFKLTTFLAATKIFDEMETSAQKQEYARWLARNDKILKEINQEVRTERIVNERGELLEGEEAYTVQTDQQNWKSIESEQGKRFIEGVDPSKFRKLSILGMHDNTFQEMAYLSGLDGEELLATWQHNLGVVRKIATDPTLSSAFSYSEDSIRISIDLLSYGKINIDNISLVAQTANTHFPGNQPRYAEAVLPFAHLPPETFAPLNELAVHMLTEVNPALETADLQDWERTKLTASEGAIQVMAQLRINNPDLVKRRAEFLNQFPAEYATVYAFAQNFLVSPSEGVPLSEYQTHNLQVEERLMALFTKLSERPQSEVLSVLGKLVHEFSTRKRDDVQKALKEYGYVDKKIRPWLLMALQDETPLPAKPETPFFQDSDRVVRINGSQLVARYFTSKELSLVQDVTALGEATKTVDNKPFAQELGQRRIEHAANYQSTEGYVWLRELVQNAFNATRAPGTEKTVAIQNYTQGDKFVIAVDDPVGMPLNTVVNALLVPQKSQWASQEAIGYFGQGFYTVFKEADEVRIKTSTGDGSTAYVSLKPVRSFGSEKIMDLDISIAQRQEDFKGTSVMWMKQTDFVDFEGARAKSEIMTYAGLIPKDQLSILWNSEQINKNAPALSSSNSPLGEIKMLYAPGENTVTQNGLYIREVLGTTEKWTKLWFKTGLEEAGF